MLLMEMTDASDSTVTPLVAGFQLGTYRIEAPIGEGGMGVVVRAHDTKLNRPVAIKFLSDELADAAARRHFQQEAQMASSLNHPHILTVYDVGEFEGRQYLVTEFVDGWHAGAGDFGRDGRTGHLVRRRWKVVCDLGGREPEHFVGSRPQRRAANHVRRVRLSSFVLRGHEAAVLFAALNR
jgi:Protein kinase domain